MKIAVLSCLVFPYAACVSDKPLVEAPAMAVRLSGEEADAAEPAIVRDGEGNLYVVYVEHEADKKDDVYLQKVDGEMKNAGPRTRVNKIPGIAKTWRGDPPTIAVGPTGSIYVGWRSKVEGGNDLMLSVSTDGGQTFTDPVKVNDDSKPASHGMHSLAVDGNNNVFVAWLDERNIDTAAHVQSFDNPVDPGSEFYYLNAHHNSNTPDQPEKKPHKKVEMVEPNSEVFFSSSKDGGKTFSANKKLAVEVCPCCKTALTIAPNGTLYISWRQVLDGDFRHIAVASSTDGGQTFSEAVIVSDDEWKINACPISGAALSAEDDALKVLWYTAGDAGVAGVYTAESKDNGKTFSPRTLVNSDAVGGTPVITNQPGGKASFVYPAKDGKVTVEAEIIDNATLPAAVHSNGKGYTAFVRNQGEKRAVWISATR
ncbi:MAG: exo-alpha-sialidase [Saprospiraceae bacterium]|nr:exo-alpha-sialidase [Pyrinomonadaceae bacterium]